MMPQVQSLPRTAPLNPLPTTAPSSRPPLSEATATEAPSIAQLSPQERLQLQTESTAPSATASFDFLDDPPLPTVVELDLSEPAPSEAPPAPASATEPATSPEEAPPLPTLVNLEQPSEPEAPQGPSLDKIREKKGVLHPGESSPDVPKLLEMLGKLGYKVQHEGNTLEGEVLRALKKFQADYGLASQKSKYSGQVGKNTIDALDKCCQRGFAKDRETADALVSAGKSREAYTGKSQCLRGVWMAQQIAFNNTSRITAGAAFQAADELARDSRFKEIEVTPEMYQAAMRGDKDMQDLLHGAQVIYNRSSGFSETAGHAEIWDMKNKKALYGLGECSLDRSAQMIRNARFFIPTLK